MGQTDGRLHLAPKGYKGFAKDIQKGAGKESRHKAPNGIKRVTKILTRLSKINYVVNLK